MEPQSNENRVQQADQKKPMVGASRRRICLLLMLVAVAGGAAAADYYYLPPPKPIAFAIFRIQAQPEFFIQPTGDAKIDFEKYRQEQTKLIRNRLVLTNALSQAEVKKCSIIASEKEPVAWLENQLKIDFPEGAEFMRVSLEGDNADELKTIISALTSAYLKEVQTKDKFERFNEFNRKLKSLEKYQASLYVKRKQIMDLEKALVAINPDVAGAIEKVRQERIGQYKNELGKLEVDILAARVELGYHQRRIEQGKEPQISEAVIESALKESPVYHDLLFKQEAARKALGDLKSRLPADQPVANAKIAEKQDQLQEAIRNMDNFKMTMRPVIVEQFRKQLLQQEDQRLESLRQSIDIWMLREQAVDKRLRQFIQEEVKPFKGNQVALEQLKSDVAQTAKIVDRIQADVESIKPDLDSPVRVNLWQEPVAVTPAEPTLPVDYRPFIVGLAVFAVGIGLLAAFRVW